MTRLLVAAAASALCGCVSQSSADYMQPEPVLCLTKAQCDSMWSLAQSFVAQRSGYKIQAVGEFIIQTHGPFRGDTALAMQVIKRIDADGSGEIVLTSSCGNLFGCIPTVSSTGRAFRAYLTKQ